MAKKIKDCKNCKHFKEGCYHPSNIGILIKYRQQSKFCVKSCEELNNEGCTNWEYQLMGDVESSPQKQ